MRTLITQGKYPIIGRAKYSDVAGAGRDDSRPKSRYIINCTDFDPLIHTVITCNGLLICFHLGTNLFHGGELMGLCSVGTRFPWVVLHELL